MPYHTHPSLMQFENQGDKSSPGEKRGAERRQEKWLRKGLGMEDRWVRACFGILEVKTGEQWKQLREEVRTVFCKGSDTGFGLGGWTEVKPHLRTGQDSGEAGRRREQGLDVRRRSEAGNNGELFRGVRAGK